MNLKIIASSKKPVLIEGETGVGKSRLAKRIFEQSAQSKYKFCQVNIAALTSELFESELFGHVKGAFTGAFEDKRGFCESVGSGVLFLDEIGELSLKKQASLLTLIDENIFYRVGSTQRITFRGKLIFATNKNLALMVEQGEFRRDLYYRLRFFHIVLPALRDKAELRELIWDEFQALKVKRKNYDVIIDQSALESLYEYSWPGNYRELMNTLEYFFELGKRKISRDDIPSWITLKSSKSNQLSGDFKEAWAKFEKDFLITHLKKYNGKINLTSFKTGINKVTLISKLKKYDINRKDYTMNEYGQVNGF